MTENFESSAEIYEALRLEAEHLKQQIDSTFNPFKKRQLMREYVRLLILLQLKPKAIRVCHCITFIQHPSSNTVLKVRHKCIKAYR